MPSLLPHQLPIPSPFSLSVESHQWSSRPPIQLWTLFLIAFAAALALTTTPKGDGRTRVSNFDRYPQLIECRGVRLLGISVVERSMRYFIPRNDDLRQGLGVPQLHS